MLIRINKYLRIIFMISILFVKDTITYFYSYLICKLVDNLICFYLELSYIAKFLYIIKFRYITFCFLYLKSI